MAPLSSKALLGPNFKAKKTSSNQLIQDQSLELDRIQVQITAFDIL